MQTDIEQKHTKKLFFINAGHALMSSINQIKLIKLIN